MGVLYAKVSGQWVPIAPAGTVGAPAYVGPRKDYAPDAAFAHLSMANDIGFFARPPGYLYANLPANGWFQINDVTGVLAYFKAGFSELNGWSIGNHPVAPAYAGLWRTGATAIESYTLLSRAQETLLNVPGGGMLEFRIGNVNKLRVSPTSLWANQVQLSVLKSVTSLSWADAQVLSECESGGGYSARVCLHQYYAPQIRVGQGWGEVFQFVNESGAAFVPLHGSAFVVGSALATKHDVRTLRPQRERIVVHHDPFVDEVPDVDVMALRPVVFRRNGGPPNHVEHGKDPIPDALDSSFGIQATRERLGLIADEVQHVIPSAVSYDTDRQPMGIDYAQITVALLDHVQRLTDEVATLRYRIAELEGAP